MSLVFIKAIITSLLTLVIPVIHAANKPVVVLLSDANYANLASSYIYGGDITTDPTRQGVVAAITDDKKAGKFEAFIINQTPCVAIDSVTTYKLLIRNSTKEAANGVVVEFEHSPDMEYVNASPQEADKAGNKLTWFPGVVPSKGGFIEFGVSLKVKTNGPFLSKLQVRSSLGQVLTEHLLVNQCGGGGGARGFIRDKLPRIICDPAETGCAEVIPSLGLRFSQAQDPQNQPTICSPSDPRGCLAKMPILGKRFREAIADIIPGECRVLEDDIISSPEYQDALNRRGEPAAYFMEPLYNSGQDFIQLVHENDILGIYHLKRSRLSLYAIHVRRWRQHTDIVKQVIDGSLSPGAAQSRLEDLLDEWKEEVETLQQDLAAAYQDTQGLRKEKFDPVAAKAQENAEESIYRACGAVPEEDLIPGLGDARAAYMRNLDERSQAFPDTQSQFATLEAVKKNWEEKLFPFLDNEDALRRYNPGPGLDETFNKLFEVYYRHADIDKSTDNEVRIQKWEVALDAPKTKATICEKEKVFHARVETTWCESGEYLPTQWTTGPPSVRQQRGELQLPDINGGNGGAINGALVKGIECAGRPGDPYWASQCECKCGDLVLCPATGEITLCQLCYQITRHDINVTTQAECVADGQKHSDPYY